MVKFDEQVLIDQIPKLPNPIGNLESDIFLINIFQDLTLGKRIETYVMSNEGAGGITIGLWAS